MRKPYKLLLTAIILSFSFIINVNADCSYQERKDLLNAVKNVDISVEPVDNGNNNYSFKFNIVGLSDSIFIKYYNNNNGQENYIFNSDSVDGVYSFTDNQAYMIYTYYFVFYSSNDNCNGYEIKTKRVKKPMYNIYSTNPNCEYENNKNFAYCKKFLTTDYRLTNKKFYDGLSKYIDKNTKNKQEEKVENKIIVFIKKYIIVIVMFILVLIALIVLLIIKRRKRNEL